MHDTTPEEAVRHSSLQLINHLSIIQAYSDLLLSGLEADDQRRELLEEILQASRDAFQISQSLARTSPRRQVA